MRSSKKPRVACILLLLCLALFFDTRSACSIRRSPSTPKFSENSAQNRTLSYRRSSARSRQFIFVAGLALLAVDAVVQGASDNHRNTHPWTSMAQEFYTLRQQQLFEQGAHAFHPFTYRRDVDRFTEDAVRILTMIEERAKLLKQQLLEMQRSGKQNRLEEAAGPSGQVHTIEEERLDQTHRLKLRFKGSLKSRIYTNTPLTAQSNGKLQIEVCRDDQVITSGDLASLTVEIVALGSDHSCKGDWTEEDFDRQIRMSQKGQGSVLDGECFVDLVNGRASLGNIHFKERSTGVPSREFVLAARVCRREGGPRVVEAFMHPPFMVLVERSKANEKSSVPKLNDKVHDLKGIARHGVYGKRLEKENIYTVQDFLKDLNKDPYKLRQILEMKSKSSWETLVRHARECDLGDNHELKSYKLQMENVTLFFNCVDDLVGAEFDDHFVAKDKFGERQKALVDTQLKRVYSKLDGIKFDYVMEGNYPVKIYTNINAAGNPSVPKLLGASTQKAPGHQTTIQDENLSPSSWIDREHDLPLGEANCSAAGQSASAPSRQEAENLSTSGFGVDCPPDLDLGDVNCNAAGQSASAPTHEAENLNSSGCEIDRAPDLPLGDVNYITAGQSASSPSHQDQDGTPQGGTICLDPTFADVDFDDIWKCFEERQQTNNMADCSFGGSTATPGIPSVSPNAHGSEGTNSEPDFLLNPLSMDVSDLPEENIHGFGYETEFQQT